MKSWNERKKELIIKAGQMNAKQWVSSRVLFESLTVKERIYFKSLVQFSKYLVMYLKPAKKKDHFGVSYFIEGVSA